MMALNPYKLKNHAKRGYKPAIRAGKLLEHPDRLISIILIGNNLVNIAASSIATILATRHFHDAGVFIATGALTVIILVFAEVTPKTIAAQKPEKIAFPASSVLQPLLYIMWPAVWLLNKTTNALLWIMRFKSDKEKQHDLSTDELKTVVEEGGNHIAPTYRGMLLNVLDLESMAVEDIMVPRNEIVHIDIEDTIEEISRVIENSQYTRIPVIRNDINDTLGVLHMRKAIGLFKGGKQPTHQSILQIIDEPYFVPENTPLSTMLVNFQSKQLRIGLVVDEYGDIQGLVTLEDLLEEIVGTFTTDTNESDDEILQREDGSAIIDATSLVRDVNKILNWKLPTDGPKTINGLLVEQLEQLPEAPVSVLVNGYVLEATEIDKQRVTTIKAWPHKN